MTNCFRWIKQYQTFLLLLWNVPDFDDFFNIIPSTSWFSRSIIYSQQQLLLLLMVYYFIDFWRRDLRPEQIKCSLYLVFQVMVLTYQACQWVPCHYLLKTLCSMYAFTYLDIFWLYTLHLFLVSDHNYCTWLSSINNKKTHLQKIHSNNTFILCNNMSYLWILYWQLQSFWTGSF